MPSACLPLFQMRGLLGEARALLKPQRFASDPQKAVSVPQYLPMDGSAKVWERTKAATNPPWRLTHERTGMRVKPYVDRFRGSLRVKPAVILIALVLLVL